MHELLRAVSLFADLSDDDLDQICAGSNEQTVPAGDELFAEGDNGDCAFVITGGEIEIVKVSAEREVLLARRRGGEIIGEMSLLDESPRIATARAAVETTVLAIPKPALDELLDTSASAARAMFDTILGRWRETEGRLRQSERMAQIGTLTAGVAHELNNPAAAVKRAADQLHHAVGDYGEAQAALRELGLGGTAAGQVGTLLERVHEMEGHPDELDPLTRSDREAELEEWLEERSVDEPWQLAPTLVTLELGPADLDALGIEDPAALSVVASALATEAAVHDLLSQIERGGGRVSQIVKALKSYSYLDQAPVQEVDVRRGLDDTLLILGSKLGDIRVVREYTEDLPEIGAYGSELNQVWTNLIDNAIDALREAGTTDPTITLRASAAGDEVIIEVEDNGPGIPTANVARVFDSFFTTKAPGKGTGLGLDISYNIVANKHRGDLTVDSEPGRTTFRITLPRTLS